jgi:hypothetical protein
MQYIDNKRMVYISLYKTFANRDEYRWFKFDLLPRLYFEFYETFTQRRFSIKFSFLVFGFHLQKYFPSEFEKGIKENNIISKYGQE